MPYDKPAADKLLTIGQLMVRNCLCQQFDSLFSGNVNTLLKERGIQIYRTFVGEYATSMEMAGASISICKVDEEMKEWIDMPVNTPFYTQA